MLTIEVPMDDGTIATLRVSDNMTESDAERIANTVAAIADVEWIEDDDEYDDE